MHTFSWEIDTERLLSPLPPLRAVLNCGGDGGLEQLKIVCASRNPTSPHQTSGLVSSRLGQRFGDGSGVDLGGFWGGLGVVEGDWMVIGWAEGWVLTQLFGGV